MPTALSTSSLLHGFPTLAIASAHIKNRDMEHSEWCRLLGPCGRNNNIVSIIYLFKFIFFLGGASLG